MTDLLKYSNSDPADYLFIAPGVENMSSSPFFYPSWQVRTNYSERYETAVNKYGVSEYGKTVEFDITPQETFVIGSIWLKVERGALSQAGGTYARFVPNEGLMLIESVTFKQGSELLQERRDFEYVIENVKDFDEQEQLIERELAFTDKTTAERDALAAAPQVLYCRLCPWWTHWSRMFLKPGIIGTPIRVTVKLRALNQMVDTDGTSVTCAITSPISLFYESFELMSNEKALHLKTSLQPKGIQMRTFDWQLQDQEVAAGQSSVKIQLDNLTLPSNSIYFFMLNKDEFTESTALLAGNRYDNYIPISRAKITAGQTDVTRWLSDKELIYIYGRRDIGYPGRRIYAIHFTSDPSNIQMAGGHKTPARMNNPLLEIDFTGALASTHKIFIFSRVNQVIVQHGASLRKVFS